MTYLDRWCEGKPPILVLVVNTLAPEFEYTHQTLAQIRTGNRLEFELPVSAKRWGRLYWRNKRFLRLISALLTGSANLGEVQEAMAGMPVDKLEEVIHNQYGENPDFQKLFGQMILQLAQSDHPGEINVAYALLSGMTFSWRVWMPCWLHYHRTPIDLLRAAKNGDDQAMDQLLRVDKSAVTIPSISRRWHEIMTGGNTQLRKFMLDAIAGKPGRTLADSRVKVMVCSLIQIFGELFGRPLSTVDIRQLLDVIEKDRTGKASDIDTSIPDDDASLARALLRERNEWMSFMPFDLDNTLPVS